MRLARALSATGLALAVAVGAAGCAASAPDAVATATPASAAPTAVPSGSSAPDPLLISAQGIGLYLLGGSFTQAREMLGVDEGEEDADGATTDRCPWFASAGDLDPLMTYVIAGIDDAGDPPTATDVIASVAIQDSGTGDTPAPLTAEGVGLRSTEDDVRAAYPDAVPEDVLNADSALRVTEGDGSIVFQFIDGLAYLITVLPSDESIPAEYCA